MRTKQETERAVAILRQKGDTLSLVQAAVIEDRRTESWVFINYVQNVSKEEKDEATFFAARDAARFVAGGIALDELISDAEVYVAAPIEAKEEFVPEGIIQTLIKRIDALEKRVKTLEACKKKTVVRKQSLCKTIVIAQLKNDHIMQAKAIKYIGCVKNTLIAWARKGLINRYYNGGRFYYSKSEIDKNATIQAYKRMYKSQNEPET